VDLRLSNTEEKTSMVGRYKILKKDENSEYIAFNYMDKEYFKIETELFFKPRKVNKSTNVTIKTIRENLNYIRISQVEYYNLIYSEFDPITSNNESFLESFYSDCNLTEKI
jgi:hypothetical protein